MKIDINSDELVKFTNKLEKLHKSGLPVAIRQTLNKTAFDTKKNTIPKIAKKKFAERKKGFVKKFTKVIPAKGFDVDKMKAKVGVYTHNEQAGDDLAIQEVGGKIGGRSFIPMDTARTSNSNLKQVRKVNRIGSLNINAKRVKKNQKSRFIREAVKAGVGNSIIYGRTLFRVKSINNKRKRKLKLDPIYSYKKARVVEIQKTHFIRKSAMIQGKNMNKNFHKEAIRQIERLTR